MLSPKEVLQIDATVLAGVLILLSIIFAGGTVTWQEWIDSANGEWTVFLSPHDWIYFLGIFFSLSAIFAVISSLYDHNPKRKSTMLFLGHGLMVFGFGSLLIGFIVIGLV